HLVLLGLLSGGDQASVHGRLVEILLHDRFPFVDDARNTVAVFALDLLVKELEHLFKPFDMPARLLEVRLEGGPQVFRSRCLGQLRQRFGQLFFGVVGIAQLVQKRVVQCSRFSHGHLLQRVDLRLPCMSESRLSIHVRGAHDCGEAQYVPSEERSLAPWVREHSTSEAIGLFNDRIWYDSKSTQNSSAFRDNEASMKRVAFFIVLIGVVAIMARPSAMIPEQVRIDTGLLAGTTGSTQPTVRVFKGIPFAAPPLGENRWRAPQPAAKWDGVRKADAFGAPCTAGPIAGRGGRGAAPGQTPPSPAAPPPPPARSGGCP